MKYADLVGVAEQVKQILSQSFFRPFYKMQERIFFKAKPRICAESSELIVFVVGFPEDKSFDFFQGFIDFSWPYKSMNSIMWMPLFGDQSMTVMRNVSKINLDHILSY